MARNGTGGFDLLVNSWNPAINGVAATAADWQALIDDIATAIAQSVSADGQTPITGNIDMGGNVLSGLGAGTSSGQSLRFEQLFSQGIQQNVAAATTVDIGAQLSTSINVTGTGTISSFGTNYNGPRFIRFDGVCTLTHSATLVLPSSVNITTAAGDTIIVVPLGNPATGWRLVALQRADGSVTATNVTASKVTLTGPINEARGTVAMNATTMDLWAQPNIIDGTGSPVTITAIANAPQAGSRRVLYPIAGTVITNGATFAVDGAANYTTAAGDALEFEAVTTSTYKVHITKKDGTAIVGGSTQIQQISASVGASALTISASALSLDFRSTTLGSGTVTKVYGTPANLVISSGSTLGTVNAVQSDIAVLAINNAGTIELAAVNIAGGNDLSETGLISTTAEGGAGAADSANVIYSTTARSNVAYRVIGIIRSTQATAGTWATAPSLIQGSGGQAVTAMSSLGYGQTWQNVTGSRSLATTYYNTTGRPIFVHVEGIAGATNAIMVLSINGVAIGTYYGSQAYNINTYTTMDFIVPPGSSYAVTQINSNAIHVWYEVR